MERGSKKSIIVSCVLLVLLLVLVPLEIYAWFSGDKSDVSVGDITLEVTGSSSGSGAGVDIVIIHNGQGGAGGLNKALLVPDSYAVAKMTLKNAGNTKIARKLLFERVSVQYPTSVPEYTIADKYIYTQSYYNANNTLFDEKTVADKLAFYKSFIAPVSNAICYEVYTEDLLGFAPDYTKKYITALPNATMVELNNTAYNVVAQNIPIVASNYITGGVSAAVDGAGRFILAPGAILETFLVVYFSPDKYCKSSYTGAEITHRNSNPYMSQSFKLKFMFEDTVI